ncbi:hypothetical protein GCM10022243_54630 [Saccharothrix violaceirubra]|uniref:Uncharacterized protein n=1 Tax=Saccharothrix violaceirubra TaxID=413306 RepID=A0A7W7WXC5_9PSEU|nr:hypothetical protein [Saccharothrix violaceirubra]MBB4966976.1 hypothetical protein [Saccharothrix violaceirubra]
MTEFVLVEYGDLEGGGFVPYVAEGRPAPPAPYTAVATKLLTNVPQPPEPADDGFRYPMWSLRRVDVDGEPHWCFAVQGRGGAFGQAGMCQFLFAPAAFNPATLWYGAVRLVRADGRLVHPEAGEPSDTWLRPVSAERLSGALTALFAGDSKVVVDGGPVDVAATIGALLSVVPLSVVDGYVWTTCLVRRPVQDSRPLVTGRWPEELPGGNAGLRSWLDRAPEKPGTPVAHPKTPEVVAWLTDLGARDLSLPEEYAAAPTLADLAELIATKQLDIDPADVPHLLAKDDPRLAIGRGRELVSRWAADDPAGAITRLVGSPKLSPQLTEILFDSLLDAHVHAAPGTNPALFPPAAKAVAGWEAVLTRLLRDRFEDRPRMVEFVRDYVIAEGRPLHDGDAQLAHGRWLTALGVSPDDPASGIYPVPTARIVAEIRERRSLGSVGRAFLAAAADPVAQVRVVLDGLDSVPPVVAAEFVALCPDDRQAGEVLTYALDRGQARAGVAWAEKWLLEVHDRVEAGRRGVVLDTGVGHFGRIDHELPASLLVLALRSELAGLGAADALRRKVLTDAVAKLEAGSRRGHAKAKAPAPHLIVHQPVQPAVAQPPARPQTQPQQQPRPTPYPTEPTESLDTRAPWNVDVEEAATKRKRRRLPDLSAHWPLIGKVLIAVLVVALIVALYLLARHMLQR